MKGGFFEKESEEELGEEEARGFEEVEEELLPEFGLGFRRGRYL